MQDNRGFTERSINSSQTVCRTIFTHGFDYIT